MPVSSSYLTWKLRSFALPCFRAYKDSILQDVLAGFGNIDQRAEKVAEEAYERFASRPAGEDFDGDLSREAEAAQEQGQLYYETMIGLRQATINLLATGLFHLLEQQLAKLVSDSIFQDYNPPDADLTQVVHWYRKHMALDLKTFRQWPIIEELELVANAVKHGKGRSEIKLRPLRPVLFQNPSLPKKGFAGTALAHEPLLPLAGDGLFLTEELFAEYATAAYELMKAIATHFQANAAKGYPCS